MTVPKLAEVTLPDGSKAYVMTQEQMLALAQVAENHIWRTQTEARIKRISVIAGLGIGFLMFMASLLPPLMNLMKIMFPDAPK